MNVNQKLQDQVSINVDEEDTIQEKKGEAENESTKDINQSIETPVRNSLPKDCITPKGLSNNNIIGDIDKGVSTRLKLNSFFEHVAFVSCNILVGYY